MRAFTLAVLLMQAAAQRPAAPVRLFELTLHNDARVPLTQTALATPNVDLQLYGDGKDIVVATGNGPQLPRLFFGLCTGPCGFTLRDKDNAFDLRGRASLRFTTIVSGFHKVRPIIRLTDGRLLVGDQAEGSTADYHHYDISFADCRWLALDPVRGVTLGATWVQPDLSSVDEVGVFDILPGSGAWPNAGQPVEKQPAPPAGGWIAISNLELWAARSSVAHQK
ncbi:MAG TPA: hypothetical protein VN628_13660 [Vicinamibacterales bacterium]|nr:hypothetical protein [Vicinamibacterales bacterium]